MTAEWQNGQPLDAAYWWRNVRQPVQCGVPPRRRDTRGRRVVRGGAAELRRARLACDARRWPTAFRLGIYAACSLLAGAKAADAPRSSFAPA